MDSLIVFRKIILLAVIKCCPDDFSNVLVYKSAGVRIQHRVCGGTLMKAQCKRTVQYFISEGEFHLIPVFKFIRASENAIIGSSVQNLLQ